MLQVAHQRCPSQTQFRAKWKSLFQPALSAFRYLRPKYNPKHLEQNPHSIILLSSCRGNFCPSRQFNRCQDKQIDGGRGLNRRHDKLSEAIWPPVPKIFQEILHRGNQILLKAKMFSARIRDGVSKNFVLSQMYSLSSYVEKA